MTDQPADQPAADQRVRYAQDLTPAEHFRRSQELAWEAEQLDRYEDDQTTPLLAALVHGVLAIGGQLTPLPQRVVLGPVSADADLADVVVKAHGGGR